ncbi:MAG: DUF2845 domain-containing protein [Deltaproteobacteria bacterium]|nr:DUF2845 domain-containing protein [Deltaproteobacteria bacterium]
MHKRPKLLMFLFVLMTLTAMMAVPVLAQMGQSVLSPVRCGTKLVQVGKDTKDSVLAKCGEPHYRYPGRRGGGEVWSYNRGSGRFSGVAKFTGNMLTSIEVTGYGFPEPSRN